jgi:tetratricopeptide (TPR) repeat protein
MPLRDVNPTDQPVFNRTRIRYAKGYVELGLFRDARQELESIDGPDATSDESIAVWIDVLVGLEQWEDLELICGGLTERQPEEPRWWLLWAHAQKMRGHLQEARSIGLRAIRIHPCNPAIRHDLARYCCLLGDLPSACRYVGDAIELDPSFRQKAVKDPDLEAMRGSGLIM